MIDHHWSEAEAQMVAKMLTNFLTSEEVAACVGCEESDLDELALESFEMPFSELAKKYAAQGRGIIKSAVFQSIIDGNVRNIEKLPIDVQHSLGLSPVEHKKQVKSADSDNGEDAGERTGTLSLLQGRRKNRRTGTED